MKMTDKVNSITVVLEQDLREDSEHLKRTMDALAMIRGVTCVSPDIVNVEEFVAETRAKRKLIEGLYELIDELKK